MPAGGLFLTAGADVQKDRIEVDVWAWGRGLESWLIDHIVIEGGPERTEPWAELDRLLGQTWSHENGAALALAKLAIDTGYEPTAVYGWARRAGVAQVAPVKGTDGFNRSSPVSGPTYVDASDGGRRLRRGARLWSVAVSTFKAETYRFLRLERPSDEERVAGTPYPPGSVHLPHWVEDEWLKQFVAEQLVTVRTRRGFARLEWQKLRERNEALGLPGLCPRRRLDRRRRPLPGAPLATHGSGTGRQHGSRTGRHEGRGGIGSRLPPGGTARDPQQVDGLRHGGHDLQRRAGRGRCARR